MPGLMIVLALVLAPTVDSGLKDPWASARAERAPEPRDDRPGGERSAELRNPFESAPPPPPRSGDLKDPFERARPDREQSTNSAAPPRRERSTDLRDPFEDASPQAHHRRAGDLRDPFERPRRSPPVVDRSPPHPERDALIDPFRPETGKRADPATRSGSLELRNPFAPRPHRRAAR